MIQGRKSSRVDSGWGLHGRKECRRGGKAGEIGIGCIELYKDGDHFRMAPDREGFREEIRLVVKRFYTWHGEFEKRNSFSNPVVTLAGTLKYLQKLCSTQILGTISGTVQNPYSTHLGTVARYYIAVL